MINRFSQRSGQAELMDDFSCGGETIQSTLSEIDIINKWLGGNQVTMAGIENLIHHPVAATQSIITVADLGCGSGEMLRLINQWASKKCIRISLTGIDANPNIIGFAKQHLKGQDNVNLISLNILSTEFKAMTFDIVTATLFFHHFTSSELITLLKELKNQARIGIVINDIHRHWFSYHSIRLITKYFSRSPMVKYDAPLSVLRAFSKKELTEILAKAEIKEFSIKWRWAFRWQVIIKA
ncbi:MAG TPA: methyltransferase domain-containing protein [Cyclobacteriaceae bacterium]|nr:methyltransferase domain-containing protein [Cyclobacteriaceae bacterium]